MLKLSLSIYMEVKVVEFEAILVEESKENKINYEYGMYYDIKKINNCFAENNTYLRMILISKLCRI